MLRFWRFLITLPLRLRSLFQRRLVEQELNEEFQFYLDERMAHEVAQGRSHEEARLIARRALDGMSLRMEECRDTRGFPFLENFFRDLHFGVRAWRRSPGIWALAVATLAIGIAANATIFSLIDAIFHRPLSLLDPDHHVVLQPINQEQSSERATASLDDFLAWRNSGVFASVAASSRAEWALGATSASSEPERVTGILVSPDFFSIFGQQALLGRLPMESEFHQGRHRVVVLSHAGWQTRFAGRRDVIGQTLRLNGQTYEIIGVASQDFWFPDYRALFWAPLSLEPTAHSHRQRTLQVLAHLRPGSTIAAASAALRPVAAELASRFPDSHEGWSLNVVNLFTGFYGANERFTILFLYAFTAALLLLCCANVANLLLARGLARQREMSIRSALGASRARIFGQSFTEGWILALPAALVGILLSQAFSTLLFSQMNLPFPPPDSWIDLRFALANSLILLFSILFFGLYPAWRASRSSHTAGAQAGQRATYSRSSRRAASALVIGQSAVGLALVIVAALSLRGIEVLLQLKPGFEKAHVVRAKLELPLPAYPSTADSLRFYDALQREARRAPALASSALLHAIPSLHGDGFSSPLSTPHSPLLPADRPVGRYVVASPGALETLRIPLLAGRSLRPSDNAQSQRVAVVNRNLAERLLPGADPLGKSLLVHELGSEPFRIVGVYPNLRRMRYFDPPAPQLFVSMDQVPTRSMFLVSRQPDSALAAKEIRRVVASLDAELPVEISTLDADFDFGLRNSFVFVELVGWIGGLALFLAGCGLFAVLSQSVDQRLEEIGVRLALGASAASILRMVAASGLRVAALGALLGVAGGLALGGLLATQLIDVHPAQANILLPSVFVFFLVSFAACAVPALRASRADVLSVLRRD